MDMYQPSRTVSSIVVFGLFYSSALFGQSTSQVTLAWNASQASGVVAYNVYCGPTSQTYTNMISVPGATNATINGLKPGATYFFSVTAVDVAGLESQFSNETSYTVPTNTVSGSTNGPPIVSNTPPVITSVANQTINMNSSVGPLAFMIQDAQTPATNLILSATSSNPTLVPNANVVLSGSGSVWTVTVTPAAGQSGSTTIALTVCDASLCTTTNFALTVLPLPAIALVSPANGASYTAPATISCTANITPNGHTITSVKFFNGASLLGQVAVAPYAYTWSNVPVGSYKISAQALYDGGSSVSSGPAASVSVAPAPILPLPWQTVDIGSPGVAGTASCSNGTFMVQGAGNICGSSDNFRFLYQTLTGDGEIQAQICSAQDTGNGDVLGVMIRESLTTGSKYALMGLSPNSALRWQRRINTSSGTWNGKAGSGTPPNLWVRITRAGDMITGYKSVDGVNWTPVNSASISMAPNIYIGFAVASGSSSTLAASSCSTVSVIP